MKGALRNNEKGEKGERFNLDSSRHKAILMNARNLVWKLVVNPGGVQNPPWNASVRVIYVIIGVFQVLNRAPRSPFGLV